MAILLVKVTLLFLAGLLALRTMARSTADRRHLTSLCVLAGSLVIPFTALLPQAAGVLVRVDLLQTLAISHVTQRAAEWHLASIFLALWVLGSTILILRLVVAYRRLSRLLRSAAPLEPSIVAADVDVPLVSGLFRAVVFMPRSADSWPTSQREAALRHERAHIRRGDVQANFIANLACALYWFHPLVWALAFRMRAEQEAACDDAVIDSGFEPATYAEALLAVAHNSTRTLLPGCSMTTENNVKTRIVRLLDKSIARTHSPLTLRRSIAVFAVAVMAIGGLSAVRADQVYEAGGDVVSPRVLHIVQPEYTDQARSEKIAGTVALSLVIGTDGLAHDISIQRSLDPGLDRNAALVLEQWRFAPGTLHGEPVAVRATIEVNFRLL